MTRIRRNHNKEKGTTPLVIRVVLFCAFLIGLLYYLWGSIDSENTSSPFYSNGKHIAIDSKTKATPEKKKNLLPVSTTGEVIDHGYYTLSYDEDHEQSEWVAYNLTKKSIQVKNVKREKWFQEDKSVKRGSALHRDYTGSGYSRGHLAPAGDMAFSVDAMKTSMYMSNMSPQLSGFNGGIWNELENQVRDWAYNKDEVYVVTGPILKRGNIIKSIGENKVSVPKSFYKIILAYNISPKEAIAFIIPNEKSEQRLQTYAVTIDQIEDLTGINFFADYMSPEEEAHIESAYDLKEWKFDEDLYQKRVNSWNNQ